MEFGRRQFCWRVGKRRSQRRGGQCRRSPAANPSVSAAVRDLSGGQRQGIAIARATHWATKLVLMDEPTAALGVAETERVERIIEGLKAGNLAIVIACRNLDQVFGLADRICLLRRGRQIGVRETRAVGRSEIVAMIAGLER